MWVQAMAHPPDHRLLTVADLAQRLSVGHQKVRELARSGAIPSLPIGNSLRFDWSEVVTALRPESSSGAQPREGAT